MDLMLAAFSTSEMLLSLANTLSCCFATRTQDLGLDLLLF